jgi:hypothetical protein
LLFNKARQLGRPFQDVRNVKAPRLAREASELEAIARQDGRYGNRSGDSVPALE